MDFLPFKIVAAGTRPPRPRPLGTPEGLGDRMRTAAFAERQAVAAFTWAATRFTDAPAELRQAWSRQVPQEESHYKLIVTRMAELDFSLTERPVSTGLWESLQACTTGRDFCIRIAAAEERGRLAGVRLAAYLADSDPATAAIFQRIVDEEVAHVALASTYFGWVPPSAAGG